MLAGAPARADWVPPFKGNDTGGIIAYSMATQIDARQLAVDHCASYGKVVKFLAVEPLRGRLHLVRLPLGALRRQCSGRCARSTERDRLTPEISPGRIVNRESPRP